MIILFVILFAKNTIAGENLIVTNFRGNIEMELMSVKHLLSRQKTSSKLSCAILCRFEPNCLIFGFEAPSASCYMYREVTTGGCFGQPSQNMPRYYFPLGK